MTEPELHDVLRAVAVWSLGDGETRTVRVDSALEDEVLMGLSEQRLTGLAVAAVQAGGLALSARAVDELYVRHEDQLLLDLRLEQVLITVASALERADVAYRALKGSLLGHVSYGDPALRSFGDIDVLVKGSMFDGAVDALQPLGFRRRLIEPRPGFDARFSKGACLGRDDGMEVDLHRTLAPGAYGILLERTDLFSRPPRSFRLGTHPIDGLDRELAFVHACFHAALGHHPPRLVPLRDVAQLYAGELDEQAVMEMADSARCVSVLQRALALLEMEFGVRLQGRLPMWARAHRPSYFDRWALQGYERPDRSYAGQIAASLWSLPSARERFAYATALTFPTRDYLRTREKGYLRRLARAARVLKGSRPR